MARYEDTAGSKLVEERATMPRWKDAVQSPQDQYHLKCRALMREAGHAFSRNGFHNTSLDEVAAALNVTKPALYYYFRNKHDLLFACCDLGIQIMEETVEFATSQATNGRGRMAAFVRRLIEVMTQDLAGFAVMTELKSLPEAERSRLDERRRAVDASLRGFVADGIADGSIAPCDVAITVGWVMSPVVAMARWYRPGGPLTGPEIARQYADLADRALAG